MRFPNDYCPFCLEKKKIAFRYSEWEIGVYVDPRRELHLTVKPTKMAANMSKLMESQTPEAAQITAGKETFPVHICMVASKHPSLLIFAALFCACVSVCILRLNFSLGLS